MKLKALTVAIASSVLATQAMAITFAEQATPDYSLGFSGATAVDKQFANYINQICVPGTEDVFTNAADSASAFYCTVKAADAGTVSDVNVLFRKNSGGSSQGVVPVSHGLDGQGSVVALDLNTCSQTAARTATTPGQWTCSDTTTTVQSEVGISDVEPAMFNLNVNQTPVVQTDGSGNPILDAAGNATVTGTKGGPVAASMSVFPANVNTFGIIVSPALRDALQAAQNLTVGSDEVADMPSMSSQFVANVLAGKVANWNVLKKANGAPIVADEPVNICLRTPGSGTQAQANAFYLGQGCAYRGGLNLSFAGLSPSIDPDGLENNGFEIQQTPGFFGNQDVPAPYTYWNEGSSDMGKCVSELSRAEHWTLNAGGDKTNPADYTKTQIRGGNTAWAIGIQSTEKVKETKVDRNYFKYVAIDGVTPTLQNVAAGLYRNVASASIQWNDAVVNSATPVKLKLAQAFVAKAQGADTIASSNASLKAATATPQFYIGGVGADSGNLAFANSTNTAEVPFNPNNPVMPFNKGLIGPSTCAVSNMEGSVLDASQQN